MESPKKIAHEIGGLKNDALRFGLHGVKSDIVGSHPLESAYESVNKFPSRNELSFPINDLPILEYSLSLIGFLNLRDL